MKIDKFANFDIPCDNGEVGFVVNSIANLNATYNDDKDGENKAANIESVEGIFISKSFPLYNQIIKLITDYDETI